jgi:hypothetical protein
VIELAHALASGGVAEDDGLPLGIYFDSVDVERVWMDTAGISAEELMRELSWDIATGSGLKLNKEQERANADKAMQTVLPVVLQAGDMNAANKLLDRADEAYDVPEEDRVQMAPMPPPQEQQQSEGPDKKDSE